MTKHIKQLLLGGVVIVGGWVLWQRYKRPQTLPAYNGGLVMMQQANAASAMQIINDLLNNNPFKSAASSTEITGINPDAPKIYL